MAIDLSMPVLVVDDHGTMICILRNLLKQIGFEDVDEAADGSAALAKMRDLGALRYMLPGLPAELDQIDATFGGDPWPYGVEANRPTLEALVRYMAEQSLIKAPIPVDELFVPVFGQ